MKRIDEWTTYRTRFLVKARQLNSPLTFTDPLGRQHHGTKGDYLVESSDGVLRIAPRQIFEDIYVPMMEQQLESFPPLRRKKHSLTSPASESLTRFPAKYPPPCRDPRSTSAGVRFL